MRLAVRAASFHLRNLRTRLPFRYGVVRAPGIRHVEGNGQHYVRGLARCSADERRQATSLHADLYRGDERPAVVRIENGRLGVGSLAVPGYGVAFDPDLASMTPIGQWRFETLEEGA